MYRKEFFTSSLNCSHRLRWEAGRPSSPSGEWMTTTLRVKTAPEWAFLHNHCSVSPGERAAPPPLLGPDPCKVLQVCFMGEKAKDGCDLIYHYNCCYYSSTRVVLNGWIWKWKAPKWSLYSPLSRQENKTLYQLIWWIPWVIFILFIRGTVCGTCLFLHAVVNNSITQIFTETKGKAVWQSQSLGWKCPDE